MSKAWRVVITIVLIAVLFATVCVGVGLLTGANFSRVYSVFNSRYNVEANYNVYYNWLTNDVYNWFISLF
jgi:hypothetical protein